MATTRYRIKSGRSDERLGRRERWKMGGDGVYETSDQLHYSMSIQWSDEDEVFLVRVPELPGCITHGATYEEAVRQGKEAIEGWLEATRACGRPIPPPRVLVAE
jgi:predicted RNase H-like HicB family nuclease